MKSQKNEEIKCIFCVLSVFFLLFLAAPVIRLLMKSFVLDGETGFTLANYENVLTAKGFGNALKNSLLFQAQARC